ncbi:MAG: hypothetical protein AMXMBFR84_10150 [Candidatus Hydrogenedentota bacterium]
MKFARFGVFGLVAIAAWNLSWAESFYIKPHIQNVSVDGATFIWECESPGPAAIEYGLGTALDQKASSPTNNKVRKVRISGLKPDTTYSYRITETGIEYSDTFKTAPEPSNDREICFVAMGDTRRWENRFAETKMAEHIMQWNPEFFVINGDLVSRGHDYPLWTEHFDRFRDLNGKFMIATARGNHEGSMINDVENDWFGKYHELPGGEPYAYFTWGNTHVVLLSWEQTLLNYQKDTAEWLDKHLGEVDSKYTVVCQHFPMYCTGYESAQDNRKEPGTGMPYEPGILEKHNVDMCFLGHTHIYERLFRLRNNKRDDRSGVLHVVNGGDIGGNFPEWFTAIDDDKATQAKPTYTVIQCKNDRIVLQTFCWSPIENKIVRMDYLIMWEDETTPKALLASIKDLEGEKRLTAIEDLGAMMYQPAANALMPYLQDKDVALQRAAATAIRSIGAEEAAPAALAGLNTPDVHVRRELARSIEIAMPKSLAETPEFQAALNDPGQDEQVRQRLIGALQLHADPAFALKCSLAILDTEAPETVRRRAAYAAGRVAGKENAKALTEIFESEKDPYVLERMAFCLNKLTGKAQPLREDSPVMKSKPGPERKSFVDEWLQAAG